MKLQEGQGDLCGYRDLARLAGSTSRESRIREGAEMSSDLNFQTGKFGSARVPRSRLAGMSSREIRTREDAETSPGLGVQRSCAEFCKKFVQNRAQLLCRILQRISADMGPKDEPGFSYRYRGKHEKAG